jgi:putative N6-adenine-specific DNA methylase
VISERALSRRIKRKLLGKPQEYLAVSTPGFEDLVEQELDSLSTLILERHRVPGGVLFRGSIDAMYAANLMLSTANRVLLRIDNFHASTFPILYNRTKRIAWEHYIGLAQSIAITVSARSSALNHKRRIKETVRAGILDRLASFGLSPILIERGSSDLEFFIRVVENQCTASLNTSGVHLHKRGWRVLTSVAPIRETLAAGVLLVANVDAMELVVDPFCGSGTFPIEAARRVTAHPPGGNRSFAFEKTPFFQASKWSSIRSNSIQKIDTSPHARFLGFDRNPEAVALARNNAKLANVAKYSEFAVETASNVGYSGLTSDPARSLLVANLPYGRRISVSREVSAGIREFVEAVNQECRRWTVALVTADESSLNGLKLVGTARRQFSNGGLRVSLITGTVAN